MKESTTIIIGGGAIGLFSAYYLQQSGHRVTVIDQGPIPGQQACSSGNAGLIVPSHFIPLASPATLREGIKSLFQPSAPFGLSGSLNPELIGWLWQFYKSSLSRSLDAKTSLLAELNLLSRNLYQTIQHRQGINLSLSLSGLVMVSQTEKTFEKEKKSAAQSVRLGIPAEIWTAENYRSHNTALDPRLVGAVYYPLDGKIDPLPMLNHLKHWLIENGVSFIENARIQGWSFKRTEIESVKLTGNELKADQYLICAGEHSGKLVREMGLSIPLQPAKGFSYAFKNEQAPVSHPTLLQDSHVAITPYDSHTRLAGNFLLGNKQKRIPLFRMEGIHSSVRAAYPSWNIPNPTIDHSWSGNRPVSPDGLPLMGKSTVLRNLSVATGHAMMGISLAPVSGSIMADLINGTEEYSKFYPFISPVRFGRKF